MVVVLSYNHILNKIQKKSKNTVLMFKFLLASITFLTVLVKIAIFKTLHSFSPQATYALQLFLTNSNSIACKNKQSFTM